jgi:hypothetical protein
MFNLNISYQHEGLLSIILITDFPTVINNSYYQK